MLCSSHYCWVFPFETVNEDCASQNVEVITITQLTVVPLDASGVVHRLQFTQMMIGLIPERSDGSMIHPLSHIDAKNVIYYV